VVLTHNTLIGACYEVVTFRLTVNSSAREEIIENTPCLNVMECVNHACMYGQACAQSLECARPNRLRGSFVPQGLNITKIFCTESRHT